MKFETHFRKSTLRNAVLLALSLNGAIGGMGIAQAASEVCIGSDDVTPTSFNTDRANFTMLDGGGYIVGGTNDVGLTWDGTIYTNSSDYTGPGSAVNVTASSTTAFFGHTWTAHTIQAFAPGTYSFDVTAGGNIADTETGVLNVTVPPDMLGMHMLFDWNTSANIDVFVVVAPDSVFGPGIARSSNVSGCDSTANASVANCLWDGPGFVDGLSTNKPAGSAVWMLAVVDGDSNGVMGIPMPSGGPFQGFNANFSLPGVFASQTLQNTCASFVDTIPDAFSFAAVTNAALNTQFEADATFTPPGGSPSTSLSGLASGVTTVISITSGEYSKDGGATWTSANGTVQNGDTVKVRGTSPAADGQTTSVVLDIGGISGTFSISTPAIATTQGSNFTMLDPNGGIAGGTNDVVANWDGTSDTNVNSTVFNRMTLSSVTPFFQNLWTAHHLRVFGPGTYTINTDNDNESATDATAECTVAMLEAGTCTPSTTASKNYTFTVGPGQIGAHMLFDWNVARNIDVVNIWNIDEVFGPSQMHTGNAACNSPTTVWDLMSTDWDGDGQNGSAMIDGPFQGFKANFNVRLPGSPVLPCSAYIPTVNVDDPSGAKGCSISQQHVGVLERGDWWLVAGFLAWLGALRIRFKRQA